MRAIAVAVALLAACSGGEWVREYDKELPRSDREGRFVAALVVDEPTGRPMAGVRVRAHFEEVGHGMPVAPLVAEFETDEFGLFSVPWEQRFYSCHWVFDHPGYAAQDHYVEVPDVVEMRPGIAVAGRVIGGDGAPAAGVLVEHFAGCVHSPTVRSATTDREGRYRLDDVALEQDFLWALAPNGAAEYFGAARTPQAGFVMRDLRCAPGVTVVGRALRADGAPLSGVMVYNDQLERGPKATTGSDGSFRLVGLPPGAKVLCDAPGSRLAMERSSAPPAPGEPPKPEERRLCVRPPGEASKYLFWIDRDEEETSPNEQGEATLDTCWHGPLRLQFTHEEFGGGEIVVDADRPLVDVPPSSFPAPGSAVVLGLDGWPFVGEFSVHGEYGWEGIPPPFCSWRLRDGARVRFGSTYRRLRGDGPYLLRPASARIRVRADAEEFSCAVGGSLGWPDEEGSCEFDGLDAGPHVLLVTAPGRVGKAMRVLLREGKRREISVRLPPR